MRDKILIIGGGVAGLSAAVRAIEHGLQPVIIEKNRYLGGRVRSFVTGDLQMIIDNGQHVLSSAYEKTRWLLKKIGSLDKVYFQKNFETHFVRTPSEQLHFRAAFLPPPFHFFFPLLRHQTFTQIQFKDFWNFWQESRLLSPDTLKELTISQWLARCGQGEKILELLWKPLSLSILNTPPESGSAFLLQQAIQRSFFGPRKNSGLGIPKAWLSEIFADPAEKFIRQAGGEIHLLEAIQTIKPLPDDSMQLITSKNSFAAKHIIAAIPPFSLQEILEDSPLPEMTDLKTKLKQFDYHPIMTINIFCRQPLSYNFPISVVSSPLQWIFAHPHSGEDHGYALVVSAADEWSDRSREEVMEMVETEIQRLLGANLRKENQLRCYKIVKEKRATIAQTPHSLTLRPEPRTPLKNFILAGDWTDTGLPATIEGAVQSGIAAIDTILSNG
jgi:squalene-associated FAD-dependent desaturase